MAVLQLHIVGFPYCKDIEGSVGEYLTDAPGHAMTIRPQSGNGHDGKAIRAFDWEGRAVAYVSSNDLPYAWSALQCSGRESLRGVVVSTDTEHP